VLPPLEKKKKKKNLKKRKEKDKKIREEVSQPSYIMSHSRRGVFLFSDCLGELNPPFFNSKKITAVLTSRRKYNTRKETKKKMYTL
jgi:hypothetical protein